MDRLSLKGRAACHDAGNTVEARIDERPIPSGSWQATLAGGIFKVFLAALALSLTLIDDRPLPLWVGGVFLAGGLAELLVGWKVRRGIIGEIALGSGAMTVLAGLFFMATGRIGLAHLTGLTTIWLVLRGSVSAFLAVRSRSSHAVRTLLLVRGTTDLILGATLVAGLSVLQIAFLVFGATAAMTAGFMGIVAVSFGIAGGGMVVIALLERTWERTHPSA